MKRKLGQPSLPTLYFRDGVLSVPGYTFEKAARWEDTGSRTLLAEGSNLKDGSNVLAKIAPAQTNGSMCLEREAHILTRVAERHKTSSPALRLIELIVIPKHSGNYVVLLLTHPGLNTLGRYLSSSKVNDLLLADASHVRNSPSLADIQMEGVEEPNPVSELEPFDVMDLATFLELAIQATHCIDILHRCGFVHREVRANAFHVSSHSGRVRLVHFGNRSVSLESDGSPSSLVLKASGDVEQLKMKEAMCYLAPEQTGSTDSVSEDHRTDLYSLGVFFWTLLIGRGQMPFEGGCLELLHAIVQHRPMPVHEVRRDVPLVVSEIINKLLAKNPDARYQSAHGLKADLLECQQRLLASVSSTYDQPLSELITGFEISTKDAYWEFTLPSSPIGRERELEQIRHVIRHSSSMFSRHLSASRGFITVSLSGSQDAGTNTTGDDHSDAMSSVVSENNSPRQEYFKGRQSPAYEQSMSSTMSGQSSVSPSGDLRRGAYSTVTRPARTQTVVLVGPHGTGKSSLIVANQAQWRAHGLWGHAKFKKSDSAPFEALMRCLSSVLRQLVMFPNDMRQFIRTLREHLGPQLQNLPLLCQATPELQEILELYGVVDESHPEARLSTTESRARFQSLVESIFAVISEIRLFALFLDDLHEADDSSLDLIGTLLNSRSRMLIISTVRSDQVDFVERVRAMFTKWSKPTWINVENLTYGSISLLVSRVLHRNREECAPLSQFVFTTSQGNVFAARNLLQSLQRQKYIQYDESSNSWIFHMDTIQNTPSQIPDPNSLSFLVSQFRELPNEAQKYLIWATFFGPTFKLTEVAHIMDRDDITGNTDDALSGLISSNPGASIRGLQVAIAEGWLVQRARDMASFSHDRYWQATRTEVGSLSSDAVARMSFKLVLVTLHHPPVDPFRIAEHTKRCLPMLKHHTKREEFTHLLIEAGDSACNLGAHELAMEFFLNAQELLPDNKWSEKQQQTFSLCLKIANLYTWKGDYLRSNSIILRCLEQAEALEERSTLLRLRSTNHFMSGNVAEALSDTLFALKTLGIEVNHSPSRSESDEIFEEVKNEILAVGFEEIIHLPEATDPRTELTIALLNDAGMHAYWSPSRLAFVDVLGLTTIKVALRWGMTPGTALGFFWALEAAAERRELYRFSCDLAKLALRIADKFGNNIEKCRAKLLFCSMVSGFDSVHLRANIPRLHEAIKFGNAAGDAVYTCLAHIHLIQTRLFVCDHITELLPAAEECINDVTVWQPKGEFLILATAMLNCIRVLGGYTDSRSASTLFDTETFTEAEYVNQILSASQEATPMALNWYNSFKLVSLFCLGFIQEAVDLGYSVYATRDRHPNHRHVRFGLFYHSLALIACVRTLNPSKDVKLKYLKQVDLNQKYIRRWISPSPVNNGTWVAIVDAELASLHNKPSALRLYDTAVKLAVNNDWPMEEGWALYLQGCHFVRCGVEGLGGELQRRGISRQNQWGAKGIANYLSCSIGSRPRYPLKRPIFCSDVAVQTEQIGTIMLGYSEELPHHDDSGVLESTEDSSLSTLTASNLAAVLSWSKEIASDIHLSSALQRLTEIATETSGSQHTCLVMSRESGGDYIIATSMTSPNLCQVHENPKSIRSIGDPLEKAIIHHVLNSKERICLDDATVDSRFTAEATQTSLKAVICLPVFGNRGETFGALYLSCKYPFSPNIQTMVTLLCQQASFSIANALMFRSVQAGTKENLKMITAQKNALESARRSREDALKATKIKSNFLASMSHELRTPFSSFYGLLDLLSGTDLSAGQSDIVQTAKQSCELLLKIIDSILDYSKLEASALKLEFSGFPVENIIADCMELLLPIAAKKLDLSYHIESSVPPWVFSDYTRIRQVLMNLIGNAVKFTSHGSVQVTCSLESFGPAPDEVQLKFAIRDTGIGLSQSDIGLLFVPFQQADNSSTRQFGGTGLGLSISKQLVQLMGGAIGVASELNVGSTFWFILPVKVFQSEESQKSLLSMENLRSLLLQPLALKVLICSPSDTTRALLSAMLAGFQLVTFSSTLDAKVFLHGTNLSDSPVDFIILDDQSEARADDMASCLKGLRRPPFATTRIIHLYTPTKSAPSTSGPALTSNTPEILKMTKPPRTARLLQAMADVKKLPKFVPPSVPSAHTPGAGSGQERRLYGNVLVAEDNQVARQLLVKQLERYQLKVTATTNGQEALDEWKSHPPGYFSLALFDHHMPICDGVEAAKRLRVMETDMLVATHLPIVALSADCQASTMQLCLSAGMTAFFSKPLKKNDLLQLLSMFGPAN